MRAIVMTADQRGSTLSAATDLVPGALRALPVTGLIRPFERTAGDEFQGVLETDGLAPVVERLLREGAWNIGVGIAEVDVPLPASTRAGRGEAFLLAREAVTSAKSSPWRLCVRADRPEARSLETALWLWAAVLHRRTPGGWEVADLVDTGLRYDEVAERLGITPSAVSQRAQTAGIVEGRRARDLVTELARTLISSPAPSPDSEGQP